MFERDCDELTNWYNKMSAEDIAKDLSSAVSLIERHSENKIELESRDDSLSKTLKNGQELLSRRCSSVSRESFKGPSLMQLY